MDNNKFHQDLLDRKKHWHNVIESATRALSAIDALIFIENGGITPNRQETEYKELQKERANPSLFPLPKGRRTTVIEALKAIGGEGTTDDVSNKIVELNDGVTFGQAKNWARPELSYLQAKKMGVVGHRKDGSIKFTWKYIGK